MTTQTKLLSFAHLTVSVDARNEEALKIIEGIEKEGTHLTGPQVSFQKWLGARGNLAGLIDQSTLLKEHRFFLKEIVEHNKYQVYQGSFCSRTFMATAILSGVCPSGFAGSPGPVDCHNA